MTARSTAVPGARRRRTAHSARTLRVAMTNHHQPAPILPGATIGILGGGQLGRMLGFAARAMGYRIAVLDPDPDCPAARDRRPRRGCRVRLRGGRRRAGPRLRRRHVRAGARRRGPRGCGGGRRRARAPGRARAAHDPGSACRAPLRRVARDRDRPLAGGERRSRPPRGGRRPRDAPSPEGADRRLRRPQPGPDREPGRDPRRHRPAGPPGRHSAPGRGRARLRRGALRHHRAGPRRGARRLPGRRQPP